MRYVPEAHSHACLLPNMPQSGDEGVDAERICDVGSAAEVADLNCRATGHVHNMDSRGEMDEYP